MKIKLAQFGLPEVPDISNFDQDNDSDLEEELLQLTRGGNKKPKKVMINYNTILVLGIIYIISSSTPNVFALKNEPTEPVYLWECAQLRPNETEKCVRIYYSLTAVKATSMETCQLTCGPYGSLLPKPKEAKLGKKVIHFLPSQVSSVVGKCENHICNLLNEAHAIAITTMSKYHPAFGESVDLWSPIQEPGIESHRMVIHFSVFGNDEYFTTDTDESYDLDVSTTGKETKVMIVAPTFFGARHALETLSQLVAYDHDKNALQAVSFAKIKDEPKYSHRGIVIDTARNFLPVKTIKRILDGMSYNKLNTFHWHISDTQSFPLEIKAYPKMVLYGRYSPKKVYTADDVRNIVQYARLRGIRVIPELDAPAHVGHGWEWGNSEGLGKLVVCLNKQPWKSYCLEAPCGQMNLANPNIYTVMKEVYREMIDAFGPVEMFHFGGDEIQLNCWNSSQEMSEWMTANKFGLSEDSYLKQWSVFQEKARLLVKEANGGKEIPGIIWTSTLTEKGRADKYLDPSKYIIQVWTKGDDPLIAELLKKKYKIIMSNYDAMYLDCGSASWVAAGNNWCSPYNGWQKIYDNDIQNMIRNITGTTSYDNQLLGAEVAAWSEQIDHLTIDSKLWPRGAAFAERLWTNPKTNYSFAEHRMIIHRDRLVSRGITPERLQPEWCRQNQGDCVLPWKPPPKEPVIQMQHVILFTIAVFMVALLSYKKSRRFIYRHAIKRYSYRSL